MRVDLSYMLLILLLPVVPAFVLFRFLPSSATAEGPLKGLNIKLGGAFAGYIVAVLVAWQIADSLLQPNWSDNWNVIAHIEFDRQSANHPPVGEALVVVRPPSAVIDPGGTVQIPVAISRAPQNGLGIQRLIVSYDGYEPVTVPLDASNAAVPTYGGEDYQVTFNNASRQIVVRRPIVLTRLPR